MPKVVSLKLRELRKRGYNDVSEWLSDPKHLYIGRKMNISIYTQHRTTEPPGTEVNMNRNGTKILFRPYPMKNVPFDKHLLSFPVGSYVDNNGKIIHLCCIPQSKWHNPFKVRKTNSRGQSINQFEQYLLSNHSLLNNLNELENYTEIGCWCKPLSCHGDTILRYYHKQKIKQKNTFQNMHNKSDTQRSFVTNEVKDVSPRSNTKQIKIANNSNNNNYVDVWDMPSSVNCIRNTQKHSGNNQRKVNKYYKVQMSLSIEMKNNISVQSALCIIPPESKWRAIQNIRKSYDPGYTRWFPHINILFPFIEEKHFDYISKYIANVIHQNNIKCFHIHLNCFDVFDRIKANRKSVNIMNSNSNSNYWNESKIETLFLKPHGCYQELQKLFSLLKKEWGKCASNNGGKYVPHLTVGKFKIKHIMKYKSSFQSSWKPISFRCDAIYLISRRGNEPFKIRKKIQFS